MTTHPDLGQVIYTTLLNHAGVSALVSTRIYDQIAQDGDGLPALPYVVFYIASELMANTTPRDDLDATFRVEAVGERLSQAKSVQDAVYTALHRQGLTIAGWSNYWTVFDRLTTLVDVTEGRKYYRRIMDFRVKVSAS